MHLDIGTYSKYQCCMFLTYTIILVFGLVLWGQDFGTYGEVIFSETLEWNRKTIKDVISTTESTCPANY